MIQLDYFIEELKNAVRPNTQLEIYRFGQVLIQVFNCSDVKNWGWDLEGLDNCTFVISIFFNKNKFENQGNLNRFKRMNDVGRFQKNDIAGPDSYFSTESKQPNEMADLVANLLQEIFLVKDSELEVFLNCYD